MKSNILFIMHMPPPIHGAAVVGKYIHDSELINKTFDCHYINLATAKNLKDIGKFGFYKVWDFFTKLIKIRKTLHKLRPKLVYITPNACGFAFYKDFLIVKMIKVLGYKVVLHYHNKGVKNRQDRFVDNLLYKYFFSEVKVILLAEQLYDDMKKYVNRENVYICPNGIPDISLCSRSVLETERLDKTIPHILFLSNLLIDKGVFVLLDALNILKTKNVRFFCDFVGGETMEINREKFEIETIKRDLKGYTKYHGKKMGDEKDEIFQRASIFVLPSFYSNEAFPLVNIEAMAHKLPVISTFIGGIPAEIENGEEGFVIEPRNANVLADRIQWLLENPNEAKLMGERGRMKFEREFNIKVFEKRITNILQTVIDYNNFSS